MLLGVGLHVGQPESLLGRTEVDIRVCCSVRIIPGMYPRPAVAKTLMPRDEPDALAHLGERALGDRLGTVGAGLSTSRYGLVRLESVIRAWMGVSASTTTSPRSALKSA